MEVPIITAPLRFARKIGEVVAMLKIIPFAAVDVPIMTLPPLVMLKICPELATVRSVLEAG